MAGIRSYLNLTTLHKVTQGLGKKDLEKADVVFSANYVPGA